MIVSCPGWPTSTCSKQLSASHCEYNRQTDQARALIYKVCMNRHRSRASNYGSVHVDKNWLMHAIVPKFSPSKAQFFITAPLISLLFCEPSLKGELETTKENCFRFQYIVYRIFYSTLCLVLQWSVYLQRKSTMFSISLYYKRLYMWLYYRFHKIISLRLVILNNL